MTRLRRGHWLREISELDPDTDYEKISRIVSEYEFPWDIYQALRLALFRTYAVPSIGRLLYDTAEFTTSAQRRHDDTALILFTISHAGLDSPEGHAAIRRMNQMHGSYDISPDDLRYVLAAFVVTPARWIGQYGWRRQTSAEELAGVRYWQRLGRLMGIPGIPQTFEEFSELLDAYEAEHFAPDDKCRAVADSTLGLFESFYPRLVRRPVNLALRALMDDPLLAAFGYRKPAAWIVALIRRSVRLRGRLVALKRPRSRPKLVSDYREIRSYRDGYDIENLGTFPTGCPVPHREDAHLGG